MRGWQALCCWRMLTPQQGCTDRKLQCVDVIQDVLLAAATAAAAVWPVPVLRHDKVHVAQLVAAVEGAAPQAYSLGVCCASLFPPPGHAASAVLQLLLLALLL